MIALFAFAGDGVLAQDHGQNRNDQNRQDHTKFDDHDQQAPHPKNQALIKAALRKLGAL